VALYFDGSPCGHHTGVHLFLKKEFPEFDASGYPKLLDGLTPYGSKNVIGFGNAQTHQRTIKEAKESCKTPCVRVFLEWLPKGNEETTTIPIAASLAKTRVLYDYDGLVDELQGSELSPELMAAIDKSVEEKFGKITVSFP
jgi:hypothetical protein